MYFGNRSGTLTDKDKASTRAYRIYDRSITPNFKVEGSQICNGCCRIEPTCSNGVITRTNNFFMVEMNTIAERGLPWWNARVTKNWLSVANVGIEFITLTSTKLNRFIVLIQSLKFAMVAVEASRRAVIESSQEQIISVLWLK